MSTKNYKRDLANVLTKIQNLTVMEKFLTDLLTPGEYEELATRWQIVKRLHHGIPQREIAEDLGVGIATVTRGSHEMQNKAGGFKQVLNEFFKYR